jgi:hypothetical protein
LTSDLHEVTTYLSVLIRYGEVYEKISEPYNFVLKLDLSMEFEFVFVVSVMPFLAMTTEQTK